MRSEFVRMAIHPKLREQIIEMQKRIKNIYNTDASMIKSSEFAAFKLKISKLNLTDKQLLQFFKRGER